MTLEQLQAVQQDAAAMNEAWGTTTPHYANKKREADYE